MVFKVCAKILVRLLLEHDPLLLFFVHFQFGSDLKFCNIASSLILLIFHLLLLVFLVLIYIYIFFSGFFFLFSYFTKWETEWWTADNIYNYFPLLIIIRFLLTWRWFFFVRCKQTGLSATGVCFLLLFLLLLVFFFSSFKCTPSFLPRSPHLFIAGGPWFVWRCCHHLDVVSYTWRRRRWQRQVSILCVMLVQLF